MEKKSCLLFLFGYLTCLITLAGGLSMIFFNLSGPDPEGIYHQEIMMSFGVLGSLLGLVGTVLTTLVLISTIKENRAQQERQRILN